MEKTKRFNKSKAADVLAKYVFIVCALASVVAVFGIVGYILYGSVPAFQEVGFFKLIFGTTWMPTSDKYGILPMIVNSLIVTLCATLIGGIIGVFTAIFLSFWCPKKFHLKYGGSNKFLLWLVKTVNKINLSTIFDQIIKLLAGIPSIVYGLFGLEVIVPVLAVFSSDGEGKGILACSILLAIMIIPTIASLTKTALDAVPQSYFEGALGLGSTKPQAVFRTVVPAARSGVISAIVLGVGRAIGEAMAVIWVSGNRAVFPDGLFSYIRTMTTNIVMEMGYASDTHLSALIATGLVLLVFVLLITLSLNLIPKEFKGKKGTVELIKNSGEKAQYCKKGRVSKALMIISVISAVLVALMLAVSILYIVIQGTSNWSSSFFSFEQAIDTPTLWPSFFATLEVIVITLLIALPLGIGAAIYLNEYSKPNSKFVKVIRNFIDALSGVPSIVFGLFGDIVFVALFGKRCVLSGSFTMVLVVLPTIIRSTEESLKAVPMALREASYGLGATKVRTIFKIVLPAAFPGIATASILAIGRIIGESAALVFTMGTSLIFTGNPASTGSTLAVLLYYCGNEALYSAEAYMLALILLVVSFALNLIVYFIQRHIRKKH